MILLVIEFKLQQIFRIKDITQFRLHYFYIFSELAGKRLLFDHAISLKRSPLGIQVSKTGFSFTLTASELNNNAEICFNVYFL